MQGTVTKKRPVQDQISKAEGEFSWEGGNGKRRERENRCMGRRQQEGGSLRKD